MSKEYKDIEDMISDGELELEVTISDGESLMDSLAEVDDLGKFRGFEVCSGYEGKAIIPVRGSKGSAGYDFSIVEDVTIEPMSYSGALFTGIKAYMMDGEVLEMYPRSSLFKNYGVIFANSVGIIDSDYYNNTSNEGNIGVMLYNLTDKAVTIPAGTRVAQGIFTIYFLADGDTADADRVGGIGSTGK